MKQTTFLNILFLLVLYAVTMLYKPFLVDIAIAALLAVATSNIHALTIRALPRHLRDQKNVTATTITTMVLAVVLFGPILYFVVNVALLINDLPYYMRQFDKVRDFIDANLMHFPKQIAFVKPEIEKFLAHAGYTDQIISYMGDIGKKSALFLWDIVLILTFYFFAYIYGKDILAFIVKVSPLEKKNLTMIFDETAQVMGVVFYSSIATAVFEGALFGAVTAYLDYDGIFWGVMYGFASMIPVVGGLILWLPLALHQLSMGHVDNAILIAVYSVVVISVIADTLIKPLIIDFINGHFVKKPTEINSLLIFFSIVAGLGAFGFWGLILGPATTALFISLLKIYSSLKLVTPSPGGDEQTSS